MEIIITSLRNCVVMGLAFVAENNLISSILLLLRFHAQIVSQKTNHFVSKNIDENQIKTN